MQKKEIQGLDDIREMVDGFYALVRQDDLIGPLFAERIQDWQPHLDKMYRFWNGVLFHEPGYDGRPFPKHMALPLEDAHFERWLSLFYHNLDARFTGPVAEEARLRARTIASIFLSKILAMRAASSRPAF